MTLAVTYLSRAGYGAIHCLLDLGDPTGSTTKLFYIRDQTFTNMNILLGVYCPARIEDTIRSMAPRVCPGSNRRDKSFIVWRAPLVTEPASSVIAA
jgi:hypothetical protein